MKINFKSYMLVFALASIAIIFALLSRGLFLSPRNLTLLARQTVIVGMLAIGVMFVMVAGHIDLSVGSLLGFCGTLAAILQVWYKWETVPTILIVLLVGGAIGLFQGFIIAQWKVPSFIITLGGLLAYRGLKLGVGKSLSIAPMNPSYSYLGQAFLAPVLGIYISITAIFLLVLAIFLKRKSRGKYNFSVDPIISDIFKILLYSFLIILAVYIMNYYKGIPVPVVILLFFALIFSFVGNKTVFGRNVYAVGGNLNAAKLSGIKTQQIVVSVFVLSGMFAALAGIVLTARLDAATVVIGDTMELNAIAACVVGGTSMTGGVGKIPKVLLGALVMASLDNGMSLINLENSWQFVAKGLVLMLAVWADTRNQD